MRQYKLEQQYFDWMYNIVCHDRYDKDISYRKLSEYLHDREFFWILDMDENRAKDGLDLRYRFCVDHECLSDIKKIDYKPCSVLEMMLALAIRCEETIMDDPCYGDRTAQWFWSMVGSLGLRCMTDDHFDAEYTKTVIDKLLYREYCSNGEGGLFIIDDPPKDLRDVEIWNQLSWYLDTIT